jgi:hypothetical protein
MDYIIKPFHPATGSSSGQPMPVTRNESRETASQTGASLGTNSRGVLPSPDVSTSPAPAPVQSTQCLDLDKGAERCRILRAARTYLAQKLDQDEVAALVGVSAPTLCRLLKKFGHLADHEITTERLASVRAGGVPSDFEVLLKLPGIIAEMNRLYAATMGASCAQATNDRRTGSMTTVLLRLADFAAVPPHLAEKLRAGSQPKCLVDYLKSRWTPEMEAKFRGQKHYQTATIAGCRNLTEQLPDGSFVPLQPGRVWVFDDMSSNIPFWFDVTRETAETISDRGLRQLVDRHGCALGRQGLYAWDWASGAWLGFELVGRLRDAYQASDILRFIRKLVSIYGKPEKIIMERGTWESHAVSGWAVKQVAEEEVLCEVEDGWKVDEIAADESARIQDGIRAIGVEIIHTHTPRGKPIEGAFNYHQRLVPTFLNNEAVNIGRHAGEWEWSARQHRRAITGVLHPRDLGFIHIDRLADVVWQAMQWEGHHDKARRNGHPLEILTSHLQSNPMPAPSERDMAVFLPEKRSGTIRNGTLNVDVNCTRHQFLNPEIFAALGDGVRVDFAFDPSEPTLGAAVYNTKGFLCWAAYLDAGPVISALDRTDVEAVQLIKRYKLAHRTAARMLDFRTLRTIKTAERRDGAGQVATVDNNTAVPAPRPGSRAVMPPIRSILAPRTEKQIASQRNRNAATAARSRELAEMQK